LVLAAIGVVRALTSIAIVDPGYVPARAAFLQLDLPRMSSGGGLEFQQRQHNELRRLLEIVEMSPAIAAAALTDASPLHGGATDIVSREGFLAGEDSRWAVVARITPAYFSAAGIPLLRGRVFDKRDGVAGGVAIIDESLAGQMWPGEHPIGRSLALASSRPALGPTGRPGFRRSPQWLEVVGLVGSVKGPLSEGTPRPFVYKPMSVSEPVGLRTVILARGRGPEAQIIETLRAAAARGDDGVGILQARTLQSAIDDVRYPRRVAASLLGLSALLGLALASLGTHGVVSYAVNQRLKELGIRSALGAERRDIIGVVMKDGTRAAALGVILGVTFGYSAIRLVSHRLVAIPAVDAATLLAAPLLVTAVIFAACHFAARRAARVNPIHVLRGL
jgi:putative ABC transport system permease protein